MLIDYNVLVALLEKSGLPDQGAPPSMGITIRFKEIKPIEGTQQFTTPEGGHVGLALNASGEVCAIGMTRPGTTYPDRSN